MAARGGREAFGCEAWKVDGGALGALAAWTLGTVLRFSGGGGGDGGRGGTLHWLEGCEAPQGKRKHVDMLGVFDKRTDQ